MMLLLLLPQTRTYTHRLTNTYTFQLWPTRTLRLSSILRLFAFQFFPVLPDFFSWHTHTHISHWFRFTVGCEVAQGRWIRGFEGGRLRYGGRAGGSVAAVRLGMRKGGGRWVQEDGVVFLQVPQQQSGALTVLVHSLCSRFHQVELCHRTWSPYK